MYLLLCAALLVQGPSLSDLKALGRSLEDPRGLVKEIAVTPNLDSNDVSILDLDRLIERDRVPTGGSRPFDIAIEATGKRMFIAHQDILGGSGDVTIMDPRTGNYLGKFHDGLPPDGLLVDPKNRFLVVRSGGKLERRDLSQIGSPAVQLDLGNGGVAAMAVGPDGETLFAYEKATERLFAIGLERFKVKNEVALDSSSLSALLTLCAHQGPHQPLVLYAVFGNAIVRWDTFTGQVQTVFPGLTLWGADLLVSNGVLAVSASEVPIVPNAFAGLFVVDASDGSWLGNVPQIDLGGSTALGPPLFTRHGLYLPAFSINKGGLLTQFSLGSLGAEDQLLDVGWTPLRPELTQARRHEYLLLRGFEAQTDEVTVLDLLSEQVLTRIPVGANPREIEVGVVRL